MTDDSAVGTGDHPIEGDALPETTVTDVQDAVLPTREPGRRGFVRAGNEDLWVEARGAFKEEAVKGYAPTPESDQLRVELGLFDGPLDLLLHLCEKEAVDILDIPIARITEQYLRVIDEMRALDLDIAGEFLVMAAQLAHIKSKLLLPKEERQDADEEEEDPRVALARRLLEYQRYKEVAEKLGELPMLGRDVFGRHPDAKPFDPRDFEVEDPTGGLGAFDVMKLIELFDLILKRSKKKIVHEVVLERLSVGQRINEVVDFALERESFTFRDLVDRFGGLSAGKSQMIVTFLAILEMTKYRLLKIHQAAEDGAIYLTAVAENLNPEATYDVDEYGANQTDAGDSE